MNLRDRSRQILTDGTYEQEIIRIGKEDPDLASM